MKKHAARVVSLSAIAALAGAGLSQVGTAGPAAAAERQTQVAPGTVTVTGPTKVVVNQAYENVRWRMRGVVYSDEYYEWCSLDLENVRTRETAADDLPDEYETSGTLRLDADYLSYAGGAGKYVLRADCYWAGTDEHALTVKWGSRFRAPRVTRSGGRTTVAASAQQYTGDWQALRTARVRLEKQVGKTWVAVARARTDRTGAVTVSAKLPRRTNVRVAVVETDKIATASSRSL